MSTSIPLKYLYKEDKVLYKRLLREAIKVSNY